MRRLLYMTTNMCLLPRLLTSRLKLTIIKHSYYMYYSID
jgi:hypothetical protein